MKADLHGIYSIDLPSGKPEVPNVPENCWIVVQADIGLEGQPGADTFTFYVCTVKKLRDILKTEKFQLGHRLILVEKFDWSIIEDAINSILSKMEADTWERLAEKISEYSEWEFRDYDDEPIS